MRPSLKSLLTNPSDRYPAPKPNPDSIRLGRPPLTPTGRPRNFQFGPVWCKNVIKRNVTDHDKLIAHGMFLLLGSRSDLSMIPFKDLLEMVRLALCQKIMEEAMYICGDHDNIAPSTIQGVCHGKNG